MSQTDTQPADPAAHTQPVERTRAFPRGAAVALAALDLDPHPVLAELRRHEPVSWVPALGGWLVTRHDLAVAVMRDPQHFTVDDPRFSTAQVVGQSMLSLDGDEHARHRMPFVAPFRAPEVRREFADPVAALAAAIIAELEPAGAAELRRGFAGPLAAAVMARALGLDGAAGDLVLGWYDAIVAAVTSITAAEAPSPAAREAFAELRARLQHHIGGDAGHSLLAAAAAHGPLSPDQVVSNAAVLLFGGIETTEGMIANALLCLLEHPDKLAGAREDAKLLDASIQESLRLEPAAALVDRYATAERSIAAATIRTGELVRVSITAANRDPAVFDDPDRFDPHRRNVRRHLAFAHGPHVCLGIHLARLETRTALALLLARLPRLRADPRRRSQVRGLVFRKPPALHAIWS